MDAKTDDTWRWPGYNPEFLLRTFGTTEPDLWTRTQVFFNTWTQWHQNEIDIGPETKENTLRSGIRSHLRSLGLTEWEDYMIRGPKIRFGSAADTALVKLSMANH
jgi:hypothetical protein